MGVFFCYALRIGRRAMSFQNGLWPLGPEPVESPSAVSSEPNGLQVERLEAEGQRGLRVI